MTVQGEEERGARSGHTHTPVLLLDLVGIVEDVILGRAAIRSLAPHPGHRADLLHFAHGSLAEPVGGTSIVCVVSGEKQTTQTHTYTCTTKRHTRTHVQQTRHKKEARKCTHQKPQTHARR